MKKKRLTWLTLGLITACLLGLAVTPAMADGGGWPTTTPSATVTPTPENLDLLQPGFFAPTPTRSLPQVVEVTLNPETLLRVVTPFSYVQPTPGRVVSPGYSNLHCWPIALVALLAGLLILNYIRTGLRRGQ